MSGQMAYNLVVLVIVFFNFVFCAKLYVVIDLNGALEARNVLRKDNPQTPGWPDHAVLHRLFIRHFIIASTVMTKNSPKESD